MRNGLIELLGMIVIVLGAGVGVAAAAQVSVALALTVLSVELIIGGIIAVYVANASEVARRRAAEAEATS